MSRRSRGSLYGRFTTGGNNGTKSVKSANNNRKDEENRKKCLRAIAACEEAGAVRPIKERGRLGHVHKVVRVDRSRLRVVAKAPHERHPASFHPLALQPEHV